MIEAEHGGREGGRQEGGQHLCHVIARHAGLHNELKFELCRKAHSPQDGKLGTTSTSLWLSATSSPLEELSCLDACDCKPAGCLRDKQTHGPQLHLEEGYVGLVVGNETYSAMRRRATVVESMSKKFENESKWCENSSKRVENENQGGEPNAQNKR